MFNHRYESKLKQCRGSEVVKQPSEESHSRFIHNIYACFHRTVKCKTQQTSLTTTVIYTDSNELPLTNGMHVLVIDCAI